MADQNNHQSFQPYIGKAPALIQIIGGLLWLGAAGGIIMGILSLIVNPIQGIILLIAAVFMIITARSLFKMKKEAFRNSVILGVILLILCFYLLITSIKAPSYSVFISPIVLLLLAFYYKNRFVN